MTAFVREEADIAAIREDLSAVKTDMAKVLLHARGALLDGAQVATDGLAVGVCEAGAGVAEESLRSTQMLANWLVRKPLLAFLIAAGIGYVGVRTLFR